MTKAEYDKSNELLTKFLYEADTVQVIGSKYRNAVLKLQDELQSDEAKYAGYVRQNIKKRHGCPDYFTSRRPQSRPEAWPTESQRAVSLASRHVANNQDYSIPTDATTETCNTSIVTN